MNECIFVKYAERLTRPAEVENVLLAPGLVNMKTASIFTSPRFFPKILWRTFLHTKNCTAVLSLVQWARVEEKERRQTGILNSPSFSHEDFALQTTPLGFSLRWSKSCKNSEKSSSQKVKLWLAWQARGFWSWLTQKFFCLPQGDRVGESVSAALLTHSQNVLVALIKVKQSQVPAPQCPTQHPWCQPDVWQSWQSSKVFRPLTSHPADTYWPHRTENRDLLELNKDNGNTKCIFHFSSMFCFCFKKIFCTKHA